MNFTHRGLWSLPWFAALLSAVQAMPCENPPEPLLANGSQFTNAIDSAHLPPSPGPAGCTVGLDWDADLRVDVAQLLGDQVFVASGVDLHRTFVPMHFAPQGGYLALGQLPGGPDRLLTVHGADGLEVWSWDGLTGVFSPTSLAPAWTGVDRLVVTDLNGDGSSDIVGRHGAGIVSLLAMPTGGFEPGPAFDSSEPVIDLDAVDWDGDGAGEIVILSSDFLEVWKPMTGGLVAQVASPVGSLLQATPIRKVAGAARSLAVLSELSGSAQFLSVVDASGTEAPQSLGSAGVCALAGGDSDGDGDDDLLLVSATLPYVYGLQNNNSSGDEAQGLAYFVSPATVLAIPYAAFGEDLSGQGMSMVHRDLDHDGDADLALYRAYDASLVIQRNGLIRENDHRVHVPSFDPTGTLPGPGTAIEVETLTWPFYMDALVANPIADQWIHNPAQIEITLWRILKGGGLDPIPVFRGVQDEWTEGSPNQIALQALVPELSVPFEFTYAAAIRRVRIVAGVVTEAGPDSYFELGYFTTAGEESTGGSNPRPGAPPVATDCRRPPCNSDC